MSVQAAYNYISALEMTLVSTITVNDFNNLDIFYTFSQELKFK